MPKIELNVDVLTTIADHVYKGRVKNLNIKRYKSGKNAGKLFAEYSLKENHIFTNVQLAKRQQVSELIKRAAVLLSEGKNIEFFVFKQDPEQEIYTHRLEVRGGTNRAG
jgi:hypothetical protein